MYLSGIKFWNFRKFGGEGFDLNKPHLHIPFTPGLNVLIGENDSGKTAIIDAIKLLLKTHSIEWIKAQWDDFYLDSERLRIEAEFDNLSDSEAKNFTEWLGWRGEAELSAPYLRLIYDVKRSIKDSKVLPAETRAGVDDDGYLLDVGAKEWLKVTYLKPLRDAESELVARKGSRLSQIFMGHDAFKGADEEHHLVKLFGTTNANVESYFDGKDINQERLDDQKGKELKALIDKFVRDFYDKTKQSQIDISQTQIRDILEKLELSLENVSNPGLGTLNRLFMAVELLHLHKTNWSGVRLGLIEEIEAHLHPQVQLQVIETLTNVIEDMSKNDMQLQLILTTHSPNIASKVKLNNLLVCSNNNVFPMNSEHTELKPKDYAFLEMFLDVTKANLFFAKGIIMVEGWSEEILIPALARKLNIKLSERGVSVVNIGSTAFLRYSKIFRRVQKPYMDVRVAVVADLDVLPQNEANIESNGKSRRENKIQRLSDRYTSQCVKTFISPSWTLEYSLAQSKLLGSHFATIVRSVHNGTDWTDFDATLELALRKRKLKKTTIAYKLANLLDSPDDGSNSSALSVTVVESNDTINYLIQAIRYACGD
jgi:putative ATP-dependent endonuclease of OLD family